MCIFKAFATMTLRETLCSIHIQIWKPHALPMKPCIRFLLRYKKLIVGKTIISTALHHFFSGGVYCPSHCFQRVQGARTFCANSFWYSIQVCQPKWRVSILYNFFCNSVKWRIILVTMKFYCFVLSSGHDLVTQIWMFWVHWPATKVSQTARAAQASWPPLPQTANDSWGSRRPGPKTDYLFYWQFQ